MTISEMHQAKQAAEKEIAQALSKFMDSTGLLVEDIRVGWIDYNPVIREFFAFQSGQTSRKVSSVTLDVRL